MKFIMELIINSHGSMLGKKLEMFLTLTNIQLLFLKLLTRLVADQMMKFTQSLIMRSAELSMMLEGLMEDIYQKST